MSNTLALLGTIALALAALLTLLVAAMTSVFTMKLPGGPDAMGIFGLFLVQLLSWLLVLAAAFGAVAQGSFRWLTPSRALAAPVVFLVAAGLGGLGIAAANASLTVSFPARTLTGFAGAFLLPLLVQAYLLAHLRTAPAAHAASSWPRPIGGFLAVVAVVAWGLGVVTFLRAEAKRAEARAAEARRDAERDREQVEWQRKKEADDTAALDGLADDAPIETFVTHLFIDKSAAHQQRALARIRQLPDLTARLATCLSGPEPLQREYCANFIHECKDPDPVWAPAVRKAISLLAEDYRLDAKDRSRGKITHVTGLTKGILLAAQRFDVRFEAEARDLLAALKAWPDPDQRAEPISLVEAYLAGRRIPE